MVAGSHSLAVAIRHVEEIMDFRIGFDVVQVSTVRTELFVPPVCRHVRSAERKYVVSVERLMDAESATGMIG